MNASALLRDPRVMAAGWAQYATKVQRIDPNETDAAARLASAKNIDFREALDIVRGREYERQEMLDGRDMQARGYDDNGDGFIYGQAQVAD